MTTNISRSPHDGQDRALREDLEARRARAIVDLLDRHAELRGMNAMADLIADSVRWTA